MYVNGVVEWVLSLCGFFAAPTPTLPHGGGGQSSGRFGIGGMPANPASSSSHTGGGEPVSWYSGCGCFIRQEAVRQGARYGGSYIQDDGEGVCKWGGCMGVVAVRFFFAGPTPTLPHGGGGCSVIYIHIERSGVCKWRGLRAMLY